MSQAAPDLPLGAPAFCADDIAGEGCAVRAICAPEAQCHRSGVTGYVGVPSPAICTPPVGAAACNRCVLVGSARADVGA